MKQRSVTSTTADGLLAAVFSIPRPPGTFIFDSCGVAGADGGRMIIAIDPLETIAVSGLAPDRMLAEIESLTERFPFVGFTLSYDFGLRLNYIESRHRPSPEPEIYAAGFSGATVLDYNSGEITTIGETTPIIGTAPLPIDLPERRSAHFHSTRAEYLEQIASIRNRIRDGVTYQTNLTQKIEVGIDGRQAARVFAALRDRHPAPFAAFVDRGDSTVVSASPERFFSIAADSITASPIKGTRPRGTDRAGDIRRRKELETSAKDRAENVMIVDLLRNDLGRVCEFGSVAVERLCDVETHPSIFHLVSTIRGTLRPDWSLGSVIASLFPCGSITGAPKISTMRIIDELEQSSRGLSMGAIGYFARDGFGDGIAPRADASVAIRTMVFRNGTAEFNVGGGIVIDSDPGDEFDESMLKAKALLRALGVVGD